MKQVFSTSKGIKIKNIPAPVVEENYLLVEVDYSFVTRADILVHQESQQGKADDKINKEDKKFIKSIINGETKHAWSKIKENISAFDLAKDKNIPLGFGCSGKVIKVGRSVSGFKVGDFVACAGADYARHSEIISAPQTMAVRIPENCSIKNAACVSVGAFALQAVRQANPQIGDKVAVIGLGLVGLLTCSLLKIAGAQVIGIDEDEKKVEQAKNIGLENTYAIKEGEVEKAISQLTGDKGVDITMLPVVFENNSAIKTAMNITRKRGKIVVIGSTELKIPRNEMFRKEIEILFSCSLGPGRFDKAYEEEGLDYPYSYIRWTEKRNMEEFLRLLNDEKIDFEKICSKSFLLDEAKEAYDYLEENKYVNAVFLDYENEQRQLEDKIQTRLLLGSSQGKEGKVNIALIGPGNIATKKHLPSIEKIKDANLYAVVGTQREQTQELAEKYGAQIASTSYEEILKDENLDAVVISTRNDTHSKIVLDSLKAGKHVFVEMPLSISVNDLKSIEFFYAKAEYSKQKAPLLMTGFNKRFSPLVSSLQNVVSNRIGPMVINYQLNAGYLSPDHWLKSEEGGGRNLGEACHIYDLFTYLTNSTVENIAVNTIGNMENSFDEQENFNVSFSFEDGSLANLTYTNLGNKDYPREIMHIFVDENVLVLKDYETIECIGPLEFFEKASYSKQGYYKEIKTFVEAVKQNTPQNPMPLWQQIQATKMSIGVEGRMKRPSVGLKGLLDKTKEKEKTKTKANSKQVREKLKKFIKEENDLDINHIGIDRADDGGD